VSTSPSEYPKPTKKLFIPDAERHTATEYQWRNLTYVQRVETMDSPKVWAEVHTYRDSTGKKPFRGLADVALSFLTLSHSDAGVGRVFCAVNLIKNKLTNRMKTQTLHTVLEIKFGPRRERKCCHSYNLSK
jgi:hypothetical protein